MLDALEEIYTSAEASPAERLEAARRADLILRGQRKTSERRKRKPANKDSEPLYTGADLSPARPLETPDKPNPDEVLAHFRGLKK